MVEAKPDPRIDVLAKRVDALAATVERLTRALDRSLPAAPADESITYAVALDPRDPIDGPIDAPVTIVAAYELMDPATIPLDATLAQVRAKHPTDVRIAYRYLAVHGAPAIPAGTIECAAATAGAWQTIHGKLVAELLDAKAAHPERGSLEALAKLAAANGLPADKLAAVTEACRAWAEGAGRPLAAFGVTSPPTVIVNGRILAGVPDPGRLAAIVDEELGKARASGIPAASYYAKAVVEGGTKSMKGRFD